jgi:multidrug transporter EmrE-like cation transporter
MGAASQMMLKRSAQQRYASWWREYINIWVIFGYSIMVLSLLINLLAIHIGVLAQEVSIIECINYLLIPLAAWLVFKEPVTKRKMVAIGIIIVGVIVFFL